MDRLKILHLTWGLEVGGKESFLDSLVRDMNPDRFSSAIWCLRKQGPFYDALLRDGHAVRFIGKRPALDLAALLRLRHAIARFDPDIVHVHEFTSSFAAWAAQIGGPRRFRVVATLHGGHARLPGAKRAIYKILLRRSAAVVAVSQKQAEAMRAELGETAPLCHIPYGINLGRFRSPGEPGGKRAELNLPAGVPVVAMVARLEHPKDQELLIRAAPAVRRDCGDCRFLIVGDGARRGRLARLARALGLADCFHFLGNRTDVPELVAAADVCVLASRHEGLPICMLEYMAGGKPVVATDAGGTGELVRDGEEGFLVKAGDAGQLADRIVFLIKHPESAAQMGRKGRRRVETCYAMPAALKAYEDLYASIGGGQPLLAGNET